MPELAHSAPPHLPGLRSAAEVVRSVPVTQAQNGICYAAVGETLLTPEELDRLLGAVPRPIAAALAHQAYFFVPLAMTDDGEVRVSESYTEALSDIASCHRNYEAGDSRYVFISTRLSPDRFSIAFEFFINVAHAFVDRAGVSAEFCDFVWRQALADVKGETSIDAFEARQQALGLAPSRNISGGEANATRAHDERAKSEYLSAAFADALAIYMLSLAIDVDYFELRERDYPLLAPKSLAERLRKISELFPPNPGYDFSVQYRRRGERAAGS